MNALRDAFAPQAARLCRASDEAVAGPAADGRLAPPLREWPGDPGPADASLTSGSCAARASTGAASGSRAAEIMVSVQGNEWQILEWIEICPQASKAARATLLIAGERSLAAQGAGERFGLPGPAGSAGYSLNFPFHFLDSVSEIPVRPEIALAPSPARGQQPCAGGW